MVELIPSYPGYSPIRKVGMPDKDHSLDQALGVMGGDCLLPPTRNRGRTLRRGAMALAAAGALLWATDTGIDGAERAVAAPTQTLTQRSNGVFGDAKNFKMISIKAQTTRTLNAQFWQEYRRRCIQTMAPTTWRALTHAFDDAGGIDNSALNYIPPPGVDPVGFYSHLQIVFSGVRQFNFAVPNCVKPAREPTVVIHVNVNKNPAEEIAKDASFTGCTKVRDPNWQVLRAALYPENDHLFKGRDTIKRWGGLFIYISFDKPALYFSKVARMVVPACGTFRMPIENDPRYRTKDLRLVPTAASVGSQSRP